MGTRRDAYVEKMKSTLDRWNKRIGELEAGAQQLESKTRVEMQKQIDTAKAQRDELVDRIEKLRTAGDSAWKDLRKGVKTSRKALDKAIRSAASHFKQQPPNEPAGGAE